MSALTFDLNPKFDRICINSTMIYIDVERKYKTFLQITQTFQIVRFYNSTLSGGW